MSEILFTWLNTEVDLSRQIINIEKDFSNGYLLGELLHKFNQLTNFNEFKNSYEREAKINNFRIIHEVLMNIGIDFDSNKAKLIMEEKKGEIKKLLYQIKSALEKKGVNFENVSLKKSSIFEEKYSSMKIGKKIPPYDTVSQKFFVERLQSKTKAQKEINMDKHLNKFEEFKKNEDTKITQQIQHDLKKHNDKRDFRISQMMNENMRFHDFQQKFEQDGIEKWKKNMLAKKEMEKNDLDFQLKEALKFQRSVNYMINRYQIETIEKINNFEKNVLPQQENGINYNDNYIPRNEKITSLTSSIINKITDKIIKDQSAKTERDRRRRKIIVEQSKAQLEIENKAREEQLKSKLFKQSNQEKQLTYELYRVDQIKMIIKDNRELRKYMYEEQKMMMDKFLIENEENLLIHHQENYKKEQDKEDLMMRDLQISMKQKQRVVNTNNCKQMVELIIDIVEEAFFFQQINDSEEVDSRVWREWTQLFINDLSLSNTAIANRNIMSVQSDRPEVIQTDANMSKTSFYSTTPYTIIDKTLDDFELIDYINFTGQWNKNIIPISAFVKINLNELMETHQTNNVIKGKTQAKEIKEEVKEEDPYNLIIPEDQVKNNYFGDLIDILIEIKHQDDYIESERKFIFRHIPIKLAIIGKDFAGKKTQAKILSENFPFKIYSIENVLEDSFNLCKRLETPIELENKLYRTNQKIQIQKEREEEEAKYAKIKELVNQIKVIIHNGESIPDDIYVDLLIEFIKIDFPERSEEEIISEAINRVSEKEMIMDQISANDDENKNRPQFHEKRNQELQQNLMRANLNATQGIVIVNFPNTYNQAKLLENKLSLYSPIKKITQANILKENISILLDKSSPYQPPPKLIQGGLDYIFYLDVPFNECVRRAIGRRVDSSGNFYHLDDNPPPTNINACENLNRLEDNKNTESSLCVRSLSFMNTINYVVDFYEPLGYEKENIKMFNIIEGDRNKELITNDLIDFINKIIKINEENDLLIYNKHGDSNLEGNQSHLESVFADVLSNNVSIDEDEITKNIKKTKKIKKILNKDLATSLLNIAVKLFENYINELKNIFKFLRMQRDYIATNYDIILQKFIVYLKRPSSKQNYILEFQNKYNRFLTSNPDLVDDNSVKEEHHQQIDDLNDKIHEIIEKRKNEAFEERKYIMTSNWIENEMEKFYLNLEKLYQAEVDKFIGSLGIIRDYYHNLDNRPLIDLPFSTIEIIKDEMDITIPIENENEYPRVEKLHKSALRVQFQYDEGICNAEKNRNLKSADKDSKDKKGNKNVKTKPVHEEEKKEEIYHHDEELKKAIRNEKAKYRYRITLLKYWGIMYLKNFRTNASNIYNKLEDWIMLSIKSENHALNKITEIFKNQVESEEKIKYQLELETFDAIINKNIQNFVELPPKLLPAKEIIDHNRFNIDQLNIFISELKAYVINEYYIKSSVLLDIFMKKFINSNYNKDVYYGIPLMLQNLNIHNYFKFITLLDKKNTNLINLKHVVTYLCILSSNISNEIDIYDIKKYCEKFDNYNESYTLTLEEFVEIPMWFDMNESSYDLNLHEKYYRVNKLKEIIFDINKEGNHVYIHQLIEIFSLKTLGLEYKRNMTYYECLFL